MAEDNATNVERLPEHMQSSAKAYVDHGQIPGGFIKAVLQNDLVAAVSRADSKNEDAIKDWVMWMYNDIPSQAWGSEEAIAQWAEQGGLDGL